MLKYFSKFSVRLGLVVMLGGLSAVTAIQADPSDDFSFTLVQGAKRSGDVYQLIPEARVAQILRDRLDLFPNSQVPKLAKHIMSLCNEYSFDPAFIMSVIQVESSFRVKATSYMGAVGLMQVMPATGQIVAQNILGLKNFKDSALFDPFTNIRIGVAYLAWLRDRYEGLSPYYLVAAYNAGPGKVDELIDKQTHTQINPVQTKKYFQDIRRQLPQMRYYQAKGVEASPDV